MFRLIVHHIGDVESVLGPAHHFEGGDFPEASERDANLFGWEVLVDLADVEVSVGLGWLGEGILRG